jgi:hypothetical protein
MNDKRFILVISILRFFLSLILLASFFLFLLSFLNSLLVFVVRVEAVGELELIIQLNEVDSFSLREV